ncbi:regulator of CtrA degradation [Tistlia consotensis]|uniref:Regulator of CtrA degradation n=1 Tax=Tistlia consotensis USBA 355 TaxID=560819 RepID=A0A1Y6C304_9PROT|nr:DUF1465 family protein [Tistlia consotensis]SMF33079.1 regulator of CtrA degradation [Tistlia consotensis USBA 355]SNR69291.1 regulator of CtrA degradation [Tistlia consotensis]
MPAAEPAISFLDGTYREALALTREARDYVLHQERRDKAGLPPDQQLVASCESLRLTARLTQVVSWLLVQKAVQAGELNREEAAAPELRLSGREVCAVTEPAGAIEMPNRLAELLERSHALYSRVERLDALLDQRA